VLERATSRSTRAIAWRWRVERGGAEGSSGSGDEHRVYERDVRFGIVKLFTVLQGD
jgi:hypothetical protein